MSQALPPATPTDEGLSPDLGALDGEQGREGQGAQASALGQLRWVGLTDAEEADLG